uniref:G-protein coupled receptors family 3 profile domain-containing protein n=1 Tax=Eptatretus burgeri TaxID=7764 RepID=A0A8C4WYF7_EPTBU
LGETMHFDENGDPPALYELVNWQNTNGKIEFKIVGRYDSTASQNEKFQLNEKDIIWSQGKMEVPISVCSDPCIPGTRRVPRKAEPFCCFDCIACKDGEYSNTTDCYRCPDYFWSSIYRNVCTAMPEEYLAFADPLAIALLAVALFGFVLMLAVIAIMIWFHELSRSKNDSIMPLVVLMATVAFSFASTLSFLGKPVDITCRAQRALIFFLLTLSISCLLTKIVGLIAKGLVGIRRKWWGGTIPPFLNSLPWLRKPLVVWSLCLCIQVALCSIVEFLGKSKPVQNLGALVGTIIWECTRTSSFWLTLPLIFLGFLAGSTFYLAYVSGRVSTIGPEPKFMSYNILFCFIVFIAFIPAYGSTQGRFAVATEIFAINAVAYSFIGCIFFPKCYNIIFTVLLILFIMKKYIQFGVFFRTGSVVFSVIFSSL